MSLVPQKRRDCAPGWWIVQQLVWISSESN